MLKSNLPDITSNATPDVSLPLQWVGMEDIAVPISFKGQSGKLTAATAKTNVFVNIKDPKAKGIHMSRLHKLINTLVERECDKETIDDLLEEIIQSQQEISNAAKIELSFDMLLNKPALLSDESGYQAYPMVIRAEKHDNVTQYEFELTIPYSSTCPCSAALARQLQSEAIDQTFPESSIDKETLLQWIQSKAGSIATPHSQRSYAYIRLSTGDNNWPDLSQLIFQFESTIGTPVQTAVKRLDEQEFARLNATNLMFCEDAARRIKSSLEEMDNLNDYWFKVDHRESLHAHNAVVVDQKN